MQIALADKSRTIRSALRLLVEMETGLSVAGEADDGSELAKLVAGTRPELLLVDWSLPGIDLLFSGNSFAGEDEAAKVIVMDNDPQTRKAALARGAHYFVCKRESPEHLLDAIRAAAAAASREKRS